MRVMRSRLRSGVGVAANEFRRPREEASDGGSKAIRSFAFPKSTEFRGWARCDGLARTMKTPVRRSATETCERSSARDYSESSVALSSAETRSRKNRFAVRNAVECICQ